MSLRLDARQRAMLQEMGITVWGPATGQTPRAATPPPVAAPRARAERVPDAAPAPARAAAPAQGSTAAARPTAVHAAAALKLHAARALYPAADPAQTPAGLGAGWLIVAESPTSSDAPAGDAARLLDNMLRAMQLHRHPRVFLAALERPASGGAPADGDIPAALATMVATLRPAMLLVLGHVAARAALGRSEPLGRLRAAAHQIAGCPAVVTYDPAFLLRSQATKAAAWADLCRALATVRSAGSGATDA
ncbi:uracil-DNA glycosylase family protein [Verminephrobacter aporrectodeae]|uniref:uracil-DNA glycosylase family protein n=1 Tax=Verminephrobacter aporrectodeae TaxID=1110389 RepID=UPI002244BA77|nr:uracil-DNA glycosylase family protein [Verminephrobacter aporrectodeae]MCW8175172.1 hypothetical protein [Verminephrobacter aporrectodeae subsp. tuberculatae]MCW8202600.1 hypothetical protein [Verminephrobacter aporrectodeae subsp. tuberculatae]